MCIGDNEPCLFHETSFPRRCGPEDSTDMNSCSEAIDLNRPNLTLNGLELVYDENMGSTLFCHETACPLGQKYEDLMDRVSFSKTFDLAGQNMI